MKFFESFARHNKLFLISFLIFTLICIQPHFGFIIIVVMPLAVIYQVIKLVYRWEYPLIRRYRYTALAVVAASTLVVAASHWFQHITSRGVANKYVAEIDNFKKSNGRYPANGKEIGLPDDLQSRPYRLTYYITEDKPHIFYVSSFGPFDKYSYDFSDGDWIYVPD